jgi:hypothetical protein
MLNFKNTQDRFRTFPGDLQSALVLQADSQDRIARLDSSVYKSSSAGRSSPLIRWTPWAADVTDECQPILTYIFYYASLACFNASYYDSTRP